MDGVLGTDATAKRNLMLTTGCNVTVTCMFFFAKYTKIQKALRGHTDLLGSHGYNTSECISN